MKKILALMMLLASMLSMADDTAWINETILHYPDPVVIRCRFYDYEIDWSGGDELTLELKSDSLQKNQTYVITIGSDAQDSRRNKMKESYQFAFSTGDYLEPALQGQVLSAADVEALQELAR